MMSEAVVEARLRRMLLLVANDCAEDLDVRFSAHLMLAKLRNPKQ